MLYRTTRGKHDVVTAFKTIHTDCDIDGGLFLPLRMPVLDHERIASLASCTQTQILADVLNALFACDLTAWDMELAVGRKPLRLHAAGRSITACELWHNESADLRAPIQAVSDRLGGYGADPTNWVAIAVRIAFLFAAYGALCASGTLRAPQTLDIALSVGDFTTPIAAWYAREMGLPIGTILCGCNANGGLWDLLYHGTLSTGGSILPTCTPQANAVVPRNLERLIHGALGVDENRRYLQICGRGGMYDLSPEQVQSLSRGLFAAVISDHRLANVIPAVYRSRGYVLGPYAALAYGAVQDFRATSGAENRTLLLAERSPAHDGALVSRLLKIKQTDLEKRISG